MPWQLTDMMPTFLELAAVAYPKTLDGRPIKQPIGRSMVPILSGVAKSIREGEGVGYELFEMKAYIQDEWKLLRLPEPFGAGTWQPYDINKDPGEITMSRTTIRRARQCWSRRGRSTLRRTKSTTIRAALTPYTARPMQLNDGVEHAILS